MQPLHDEHHELLPYVEALRTTADPVGTLLEYIPVLEVRRTEPDAAALLGRRR